MSVLEKIRWWLTPHRRLIVNCAIVVCLGSALSQTVNLPFPWVQRSLEQLVVMANAGEIAEVYEPDFYTSEMVLTNGETVFAYVDPSYGPHDVLVLNGVDRDKLDRIAWHRGVNWGELAATAAVTLLFVALLALVNQVKT